MAAKKTTAKKAAPKKAPKEPNKARPMVTEKSVAAAASRAERRAPDQEKALEKAFESGALPETDRRAEAPKAKAAKAVKPNAPKAKYEWIERGDGTKQLYRDGQLCPHVPEEDLEHVHTLLEQ